MSEKTNPKGRAKTKIEINFADPFKNFEEVERLSKLDGMLSVLKEFGNALIDLTESNEEEVDITNEHEVNINEKAYDEETMEHEEQESTDDRAYELIKQVLESIDDTETVSRLINPFINVLNGNQRVKVFSEIKTKILNGEEIESNNLIDIIQYK